MPSWVAITLDTAAPEVDFGAVARPLPNRVEVPYVVDPDGAVLSAELQVVGGSTVPVIVEPDRLVAETVPDDALGLRFVVVSRDDVLNQKTTTFDFMISLFEVFGRLRFRKPLAATVRVSPVVVGVMLRQAVIDAKMRVSPALSRAGVITKSLLSWIKTDGGNR